MWNWPVKYLSYFYLNFLRAATAVSDTEDQDPLDSG